MSVRSIANREQYQAFIFNDKPVIIKFEAKWCRPCKEFSSTYSKLSERNTDINFCTLDIEELGDIKKEANVRSLPTFILFHNGKEMNYVIGANRFQIESMLKDPKVQKNKPLDKEGCRRKFEDCEIEKRY